MIKTLYRKKFAEKRNSLPDRVQRSTKISELLVHQDFWHYSHCIMAYVNVRGEVSTEDIIQVLQNDPNKTCILPRCEGNNLGLYAVRTWEQLMTGTYGIPEPNPETTQQIFPQDLDLILLPGIAFTPDGIRLGQGGGFYDRLLKDLRPDTFRLGLAFSCQITDFLPSELHDEHVHAILTEDGMIRVNT